MYAVPQSLTGEIRSALTFDANKTEGYLNDFFKDLPANLRMELMLCVHNSALSRFTLFSSLGNKQFVSWVSSQLMPRISTAS